MAGWQERSLFWKKNVCYAKTHLQDSDAIIDQMGPNLTFLDLLQVLCVKHGCGKIMLWACFSSASTGQMVSIEGKIYAAKYTQIIEDNLDPSVNSSQIQVEIAPSACLENSKVDPSIK